MDDTKKILLVQKKIQLKIKQKCRMGFGEMAGWIEDYSVARANDIKWDIIQFRVFAQILYMGKIYE